MKLTQITAAMVPATIPPPLPKCLAARFPIAIGTKTTKRRASSSKMVHALLRDLFETMFISRRYFPVGDDWEGPCEGAGEFPKGWYDVQKPEAIPVAVNPELNGVGAVAQYPAPGGPIAGL